MEDVNHCCISSPPDMSVTSSTSTTYDQSVQRVTHNLHSSDGDAEVSSSCEMQPAAPACSSTAVHPLNNQVTIAFYSTVIMSVSIFYRK